MRRSSTSSTSLFNSAITVLPSTPTLDVTDPRQIRAVAADVLSRFDVDVLFNNAGAVLFGPVEEYTDEQLDAQIAVNLLGPIRVTQAFEAAIAEVIERTAGSAPAHARAVAHIVSAIMFISMASAANADRGVDDVLAEIREPVRVLPGL